MKFELLNVTLDLRNIFLMQFFLVSRSHEIILWSIDDATLKVLVLIGEAQGKKLKWKLLPNQLRK